MARLAKVAVCSTPNTVLGESDEERYQFNLGKAEELLHEAAAQGADIACLPEAFTIRGISDGGTNHRWREPVPGGETYQRMAAIARQHRMYVVAPVVGVEDGVHRNVAMVIGRDGDYIGGYHKVHLTVTEEEVWGLTAGDSWPVFELDFGKIGITICYDVFFPEGFRILALKGADIIFHPTMYSMYGEVGWEAVIQSRAIDNCVYVCPVNYGFTDHEPWMPGMCLNRSSVIGPDGIALADRGRYWGVALATLDLDRPRMVMRGGTTGLASFREDAWNHRRPDTYEELLEYGYWANDPRRKPAARPVEVEA
jgi:predicted amidohydrolase